MPSVKPSPACIHPALWRASQLAQSHGTHLDTGYPALSCQLPGQGWALGQLTELLLGQAGIGELQLLQTAISQHAKTSLVLIQPPHTPQITAWASHGTLPSQFLWLRPACHADALWAAEQALRNNAFEALLLWQAQNTSYSALQRLHLAARHSETLFFMFRPVCATRAASPAPLRLVLQAAPHGLNIQILKRRGNVHHSTIAVHFYPSVPVHDPSLISLDRPAPATGLPRSVLPTLA